jgi:hypothetical protein
VRKYQRRDYSLGTVADPLGSQGKASFGRNFDFPISQTCDIEDGRRGCLRACTGGGGHLNE